MMKKFTKISTLFILLSVLCGSFLIQIQAKESTKANGEGELLDKIMERGELIVGTSPDFPPNEFIDTTKTGQDQYVGSDMDFARYIADEMGVKLTIKAMDFDAVLASLGNGQIDMAITGITKTPERMDAMEMSESYYDENGESSWQGLLIKADKKDVYTKLRDFKGKKVAVQAGSLQDYYVKTQLKEANIQYITGLNDGINLLKNGSVDAVACAYGTGQDFAKQNEGIHMSKQLLFKLNPDYMGTRVGIPKGEIALLNKTNEIIQQVRDKGLYEEWYQAAVNYDKQKIEGNFLQRTWKIAVRYWPMFLEGLGMTLGLAFVTVLGGTLIGTAFAHIKLSNNRFIQLLSSAYVEAIRGTPLLLQLWLFVSIFAAINSDIPMLVSVIVALIINSSAYVAEIIRGGILSVDKGQWEAAKSLGMSNQHMMVKIIFPQAIKSILPSLGNEFIMMVKETSLASSFYIGELMSVNNIVKTATYFSLEPLTIAAIIYLIVTYSLSKLVKYMERRMRVSD